MTGLTNSTRAILKATYTQPVPSAVPAEPGEHTGSGSAMSVFAKLNFMRSLRLTRPEIEALGERLSGEHAQLSGAFETIVRGKPYLYQNPGRTAPFVVSSQGADAAAGGTDEGRDISTDAEGNLVGTWFEYTPCSGLDIEVGSDFGDNG